MTIKTEVKTMALKDIFTMVKADRYTQDGREAVIKAREAEVEDRVYQNGEISQATGLMKTPNGWVEPPKGKKPGAKKQEKKGAGIPQATTETFVGKTYKDFVESATPSGYRPTKNTDNPDGSSTTIFEKEGKQIKVEFDKNGKITKVLPGEKTESKPAETDKVKNAQKIINETWQQQPSGAGSLDLAGVAQKAGVSEEEMKSIVEKTDGFKVSKYMDKYIIEPSTKKESKPAAQTVKGFDEAGAKKMQALGFKPEGNSWVAEKDGNKYEIKVTHQPETEYVNANTRAQLFINGNRRPYEFGGGENIDPNSIVKIEKALKEQGYNGTESKDAAYTAQSINAPREKLERTLTGDTRIRVRK